MTDTIRLAEDQLHKIMAAILTAGGKYDHPKLVVDTVERLCDEVDGSLNLPRVGCGVRFDERHWAVEDGAVKAGDVVRVVSRDDCGDYWTEPVPGYKKGICFQEDETGLEFLP